MTSIVSIITINYNNLDGLKKTFESVFNQTFRNFEYIVIDGGSADGSKELIEKNSDKINYWVSEPDRGIYNAMNKGIKVAKGEYLLFLNSGDWLYNSLVLEKASPELRLDIDIIYGNVVNVGPKGETWIQPILENVSLYKLGYIRNSLPHQAMFTKTSLFKDTIGYYDETLQMVADWAFYTIAIFKFNCTYKYIDFLISYYNKEGFSSNPLNEKLQDQERQKILQTHFTNLMIDFKERDVLENKLAKGRKLVYLIRQKNRILKIFSRTR